MSEGLAIKPSLPSRRSVLGNLAYLIFRICFREATHFVSMLCARKNFSPREPRPPSPRGSKPTNCPMAKNPCICLSGILSGKHTGIRKGKEKSRITQKAEAGRPSYASRDGRKEGSRV